MLHTSVLYLPIGRKTFDLETAEQYRKDTQEMLEEMVEKVYSPDTIITSPEELEELLASFKDIKFSSIIYQSTTFADGEFPYAIIKKRKEPIIVWSVREPSVGGRLRLNSLTGGNATSNLLKVHQHPYSFVFGNPQEEDLENKMLVELKVNDIIGKLKELKVGVIGEHPPGFFFSQTDEEKLRLQVGTTLDKVDLLKAFDACKKLTENEYASALELAEKSVVGLNKDEESVIRFAQFYTYIETYIKEKDIRALAIRCWPDFFNELGAAACSTLSQFTEHGVVSACESDINGSLSMYVLQELSNGKAPYLGDLVHVNEENNSVVFWHCGAAAYSLARPQTGAQAGVHPNRKMGLTMEFGLKAGKVTMFRLSEDHEGYRLLVMKGEALDVEQPFSGTSVEVALPKDVTETLYSLMESGFEPHYALVYDDVAQELLQLGKRLGLRTEYYG
ncbi:hypothetical protein FS935_21105 [Metabacillus litoralis]|uniref:L-fucose isomerase C-terminal domain-containing protein n=1 Tax=Metabacillus litoralis TaxID=152268 RepID=A0A5C6VB73_9BACI|nr:hypothetical protein [Metabacillus litoralis]TXC82200.1 hypothetical protein FS935_21105 [Metabacillus litoralis]